MRTFGISIPFRQDEGGQSVLEMTFVTFLLLLLVMGVTDFGRAFNNWIIIANASREGARYGSHFPHLESGIRNATKREAADSGVTLMDSDIAIDGLNGVPGQPLRVTVTYEFATIITRIIGIGNLTLRASTEMVIFGVDK